MKTLIAIVLALGLLATAGLAQPVVSLVVNAASSARPPLQNASIGQGSYFTIYGTGLGADFSTCGTNLTNCLWHPYPLPLAIQGTSINVTVGSSTVTAYPEFVDATQINAVLPSNTPVGTGSITVTYNTATSATFPITVVPASFGTFTFNQAGTGPGIITDAAYAFLTPFHTARPGDTVILFGTGLGPADATTEQASPPAQVNLCPGANCPTVWVGGQQAKVDYAGSAGFTAEAQINFEVPAGLQGCYVQTSVQTGTVIGNFSSITVDPNGLTCQDADGIDYNDVKTVVDANGHASVAAISLLSNYVNLNVSLIGELQFDNDTVTGVIGTFNTGVLDAFQGFSLAPSANDCTVSPFLAYPPPNDPELAAVNYLDAGTALGMTGPNGTATPVGTTTPGIPRNPKGNGYGALVGGATIADLLVGGGAPPYFLNSTFQITPGTYTVTGPGGAVVGPFSGQITVSAAAASFAWTNQTTITAGAIPRATPLTITWTGGDPSGFVDITLIGSTLQSGLTPGPTVPGVLAECFAPASLGKFTVPTYVMQSLPDTLSSSATVPPGELLVGPASGAVKITPPSGLDAAYLLYHFIAGQNVTWGQ